MKEAFIFSHKREQR